MALKGREKLCQSLSARRAWIEIKIWYCGTSIGLVALRKESVDRNTQRRDFKRLGLLSLSARRAWIEINLCIEKRDRAESLSARRAWIEIARLDVEY